MTRAPTTTFLLVLAAVGAGCQAPGPKLTIENPDREQVFLDGRRILTGREQADERSADRPSQQTAEQAANGQTPNWQDPDRDVALQSVAELPFRYYGATRWDVLPNVRQDNGVPVFDEGPQSVEVELAPPASPWLFPFDFPIELIDRALHGRRDVKVTVSARPKPMIQGEIPPEELGRLSARARAARSQR